MELEESKRCLGCMHRLTWDNRCTHCDFELEKYIQDVHCLPLRTMLKSGEYMVGQVLGKGGFGITYIGMDMNLLTRVAIKEYYPAQFVSRNTTSDSTVALYICDEDANERFEKGKADFLREARTLARCSSLEGIVRVRNFFSENNTAYIVMDYIEGDSLKKYVSTYGKLEADVSLAMMKQAMEALQLLHQNQLIHRDVSADNFMIDYKGKAVLIDFGSARYFEMLEQKSRTIICKEGFSAIEQYSSTGKQGSWTDVYGICATLYFMLTGIVPKNATERILEDAVTPITEIDDINLTQTQKEAIQKGMSVEASKRMQTIGELYEVLYNETIKEDDKNSILINKKVLEDKTNLEHSEKGIFSEKIWSATHIWENLTETSYKKYVKKRNRSFLLAGVCLCVSVVLGSLYWGWNASRDAKQSTKTASTVIPTKERKKDESSVTATPEQSTKQAAEFTIQSYVGKPKKEVLQQVQELKNSGWEIKWVKEYSSKVTKGLVIWQKPKADEEVHKAGKITICISKGKKKVNVTPDPTRQPQNDSITSKDSDIISNIDKIID